MDNTNRTSKRVVETVWPWRKGKESGKSAKTGGNPTVRAAIQAAVMAAIGFVLFKFFDHRIMAYVVWGLGAVVLVSGFFIPPVFAAIEHFGRLLGRWVGTGLTYILLVPFFYLVFVPGHLFLALRGKDPMQRAFPTPEASCWIPKKPLKNMSHYRKQFS